MLKILKPKINFVDWKFKITLNNNEMKIIRAVCKKILLYWQWQLQENDFLNHDGDNDSDGKVTESCSNDGVDVGDVDDGDGKKKVDFEGEANDDDDDDDDDDRDKANCDDDADGGDGNSKNDGDEDGIFENWCVDSESGAEQRECCRWPCSM